MTNELEWTTAQTQRRTYSAIRQLQKYLNKPLVNLGGGLPNTECFPINKITLELKNGKSVEIQEKELQTALQYGATRGQQELVDFITKLQQKMHNRNDFEILIGNGSQDLITKAFELFLNPSDSLLIENPTYVGILSWLKPFGVNLVGVEIDSNGINHLHLDKLLSEWEGKGKPKVLYTVASGGNPSGISTTTKRKELVYKVCQKHNVVILEDDPYFYLQYDYSNLMKSYFSMDTDNRVLRFDSFSKVLSGGARLGVASGSAVLIERLLMHEMSTNLHPSGISQMIVWKCLEDMGLDGFIAHCKSIGEFYGKRCDYFCSLLEK